MTFSLELSDSNLRELLRFSYAVALNSPDPSTQNGSAIYDDTGFLIGVGWNDFPRGTEVTPDILERPKKYAFIEHAERSSIYDCLENPYSTVGATMVCPWASCADCARGVVQSGIKRLVRHARDDSTGRWNESIEYGDKMMRDAGVDIIDISGPLGRCEPIRFNGELWTP